MITDTTRDDSKSLTDDPSEEQREPILKKELKKTLLSQKEETQSQLSGDLKEKPESLIFMVSW